jgi:hypothetical protein
MKRVPWTALEEMKGDPDLLKKNRRCTGLAEVAAPDLDLVNQGVLPISD